MATMILFGAGVSRFCGDGTVTPHLPPLGADLFDALYKYVMESNFPDAIKTHYQSIPIEIQKIFRKDFEQGMQRLYEHSQQAAPLEITKGMASYFLSFDLKPDFFHQNFYILLLMNLLKLKKHLVFASLNYEMLLEDAAQFCGISTVHYGLLPKVPPLREGIILLKPHGAANFLPFSKNRKVSIIGGTVIRPGDFDPAKATMNPNYGATFHFSVQPATKQVARDKVSEGIRDNECTKIPSMSRYMPGKSVDVACDEIVNQRKYFSDAVQEAARILIIGVRLNEADAHIWEPLARTNAMLGYVDPCPEDFLIWAKEKRRGKKSGVVAQGFAECFSGKTFSKPMLNFFDNKILDSRFRGNDIEENMPA